jgi:hypothetical protein
MRLGCLDGHSEELCAELVIGSDRWSAFVGIDWDMIEDAICGYGN